jgi:serine protease Do
VVVWRDEQRKTLNLTVALMKETQTASAANDGNGGDQSQTGTKDAALGVRLLPLTPDLRQQLGLAAGVKGVVVTDVNNDGPAAQQGLRAGDVIEQVSRQPVATPNQVDGLVQRAATAGKPAVLLLVNRQGNEIFLAVKVGKA